MESFINLIKNHPLRKHLQEMDQVYQDTICIQPVIIATHHQPRLIEVEDPEEDEESQHRVAGQMNEAGAASSSGAIQGVNF